MNLLTLPYSVASITLDAIVLAVSTFDGRHLALVYLGSIWAAVRWHRACRERADMGSVRMNEWTRLKRFKEEEMPMKLSR
jgi:hypothetical protein